MKKLLLLLTLALCAPMSFAQNLPSYVSTDGLVGYWPFNGNANDESGNGNNGTVNGATLTSDRFANANSAYSFDGASNFIEIPNTSSLQNISSITIGAWININQLYQSGGAGFFSILHKSNQQGTYGSYDFGIWSPSIIAHLNDQGTSVNFPITLGVWQYVSVVIKDYVTSFYLNGSLLWTGPSGSWTNNYLNTMPFLIGIDMPGLIEYANGKIDDIAIYNRALTQEEITNMYNSVEVPTYSETCNNVSGSLTQGLVGYWPFCGNANDDSGHGNNGTVNGATLTTDRFGNTNSAYNFDGVSNKISYNSTFVFNQNSDGALSFWFENEYILSNIYSTLFFSKTILGENNRFNLYLQPLPDNLLRLTLDYRESNSNLHILNTFQPINNNLWNNLIISRSLNVYSLYLNGILVGTVTDTSPNIPNEIGWLIGSNPNGFGVPIFYQGKIDDIGFWNRALTQSEVSQLYNQNQCMTNITVTDTLVINVGQLSYTNPIFYANNITLYPNPANTQVNVSFTNITDLTGGQIKIINSLGQQVATTPITLSGTNTTMPLTTWGGTGLYFVQILNAQGIVVDVKKIILQ